MGISFKYDQEWSAIKSQTVDGGDDGSDSGKFGNQIGAHRFPSLIVWNFEKLI